VASPNTAQKLHPSCGLSKPQPNFQSEIPAFIRGAAKVVLPGGEQSPRRQSVCVALRCTDKRNFNKDALTVLFRAKNKYRDRKSETQISNNRKLFHPVCPGGTFTARKSHTG
jgi:hypothetical protein